MYPIIVRGRERKWWKLNWLVVEPCPKEKKELSADETIYAFRVDTMYKKDDQEMQTL